MSWTRTKFENMKTRYNAAVGNNQEEGIEEDKVAAAAAKVIAEEAKSKAEGAVGAEKVELSSLKSTLLGPSKTDYGLRKLGAGSLEAYPGSEGIETKSLAELAHADKIIVGASVDYEGAVEEKHSGTAMTGYVNLIKSISDSLTPANAGKMYETYGPKTGSKTIPTVANLSNFEAIIKKIEPQKVRFHNLIWAKNSELPEWLKEPSVAWTKTTLREQMKLYAQRVVPKALEIAPQINAIDVFNEIGTSTGVFNTCVFTEVFGSTAINTSSETAKFYAEFLTWVHEVAPNVILVYNEEQADRESEYRTPTEITEGKALKRGDTAMLICKTLIELGAPLTGYGFESHRETTFFSSASELEFCIKKLQAIVSKIELTELDMKITESEGKGTLGKQGEAIREALTAAVRCGLERVTVWVPTDADDWLGSDTLTSGPRAGFYDVNLNQKPSGYLLAQARSGGSLRLQMMDRLSSTTSRAAATAFTPSQEEESKTGKDCEVTVSFTLKAEETEIKILVGERQKILFKEKLSVLGNIISYTFSVPASTPWEYKMEKGSVSAAVSTYDFKSR